MDYNENVHILQKKNTSNVGGWLTYKSINEIADKLIPGEIYAIHFNCRITNGHLAGIRYTDNNEIEFIDANFGKFLFSNLIEFKRWTPFLMLAYLIPALTNTLYNKNFSSGFFPDRFEFDELSTANKAAPSTISATFYTIPRQVTVDDLKYLIKLYDKLIMKMNLLYLLNGKTNIGYKTIQDVTKNAFISLVEYSDYPTLEKFTVMLKENKIKHLDQNILFEDTEISFCDYLLSVISDKLNFSNDSLSPAKFHQ